MAVVLKLEDIANNEAWIMGPRAWVKEIVVIKTDISLHLEARFIRATSYDYSEANSIGSRGVMKIYWMEENKIYQVCSPESWKRCHVFFCKVEGDRIEELDEERSKWLNNCLESTY